MEKNILYYGDNLDILREHIPAESVDLIYLDPPFKSNQSYNVLFEEKNGSQSRAQVMAFDDTWHWDQGAAETFQDVVEEGGKVSQTMQAFRLLLGDNDMLAYLTMMAPRLIELRRVLKSAGSIYLHCDPTASHYLKILMDSVFGKENYRNEISWLRSQPKSHSTINFPNCRDIIFRYSKTDKCKFFKVYAKHDPVYLKNFYKYVDEDGRRYSLGDLTNPNKKRPNLTYEFLGLKRVWRWTKDRMQKAYDNGLIIQTKSGATPRLKHYLDEMKGQPITDNWNDIEHLHASHAESLGYPTQKPVALLERIVRTSSEEGDLVLDPFCGCGTTIDAAQRLKRRWIGVDITHLAISLIKKRLKDTFGSGIEYEVVGEPTDLTGAEALAKQDPYQFQWWIMDKLGASARERKKGADRGIDGRLYFHEHLGGETRQIIFSVKSGFVNVKDIRDLRGVLEREKAAIGVIITLKKPTSHMRKETASAGFYESATWKKRYPKIQILTIEDILSGQAVDYPPSPQTNVTFKKAPKSKPVTKQQNLLKNQSGKIKEDNGDYEGYEENED